MEKTIGELVTNYRPEAAYFTTKNGNRNAIFVVDLKDVSLMPVIAEPFFFKLNASVDFSPAMNVEDLKKGLEQTSKGALAGVR